MLSVIVYGRNDAHGYNQHKRTAIGLNTVAELLDRRDDEIVFVDYNTPDDHPTVIEAIRDTLTPRCLARLRVLRVRPAQHRRRFPGTPYPAPEAVARNVAARRTNPANRWILSTNPDMVFVPRDGSPSLSAIAAGLSDGFYQLPRFELPETVWEAFDRRDPAGVIAWLAEWGARLHLSELVHVDPVVLFNGVGDFQLVRRDDWFAIGGCHEGMTLGWNVDLNLCVRLNRLHGRTGSLLDRLLAFHCGHGRQATVVHAAEAPMNDHLRFVELVETPHLPEQEQSWGLAGETVEEFPAGSPPGARYVPVLAAVLPGLAGGYGEGWNDRHALFRLRYDPDHALPYLLNHLINRPPGTTVGWVGGSAAMLALFRDAWRRLGGRLLVATGLPLAVPDDLDPGREIAAPVERIGREADVLVVEFGLDEALLPEEEPDPWFVRLPAAGRDGLGRLKGAFQHLCGRERRRMAAGLPPRTIIAVNAVNSFCGRLVEAELHFVRVPFSCRILHGTVRAAGPAVLLPHEHTAFGAFLGRALGRTRAIDRWEAAMVEGDLARLRDGDLDRADPRAFSRPLLAALDWPDLDLPAERRDAIRAAAARRAASAVLGPRLAPERTAARPPGPPAPCKLAAAEDWEDAGWFTHAHLLTIEGLSYRTSTYNYFKRSRGVWERAQMLHALAGSRAPGVDDRVAVVCAAPDGLPLFLAGRVGGVDLVTAAPDPGPPGRWLGKRRLLDRNALRVHAGGPDALPAERRWAAVLLPQNVAAGGWSGLAGWLAWAEARLEEGGVVVFSAEVALTPEAGEPDAGAPDTGPFRMPLGAAVGLGDAVAAHTGLRPAGPFDASLSDPTLDRTAAAGGPETDSPHLVVRTGDAVHTVGVWLLRREADTGSGGWARLAARMAGRAGGIVRRDMDGPEAMAL